MVTSRAFVAVMFLATGVAGCNSASATKPGQPAANYLAALSKPSVINPAGTNTAALQANSPSQRLGVFARILKSAGVQDCKLSSSRIKERTADGRSLWDINCAGGIGGVHADYIVLIPSDAEKFAQVLRCQRTEDGGAYCSAF